MEIWKFIITVNFLLTLSIGKDLLNASIRE